jgi:hypothetical protein
MARFRRLSDRAAFDDARWSFFTPAAPTSVTATAGNAQAVVSWTAPAVVVPPVTDYSVQFSSNSGSSWTTFSDGTSTGTSATVTGLTNGTAYVFRVAGVNGIGTGAFSTASSAVTPIAGDTYFSSVSLLLPMDGTGSTFTDASLFGRAVTAVGNATQSAAQSKWGGKSGYFDGDGDYLTSLAPAFGTQDWVIEGWFYPTGSFGGTLVTARSSTGVVGGPTVVIDGSGLLQYFIASADNSTWQIAGTGSGVSLTLNAWQHIAIVRSGSTLRAYKDGVGGTSVSISEGIGTNGNLSLMAGSAAGGQNVSGYVDDFRITVGSARGYTANFTAPTAAFPTADQNGNRPDPYFSNVSLLLPFNGNLTDASSSPKTMTAFGNAAATGVAKFGSASLALDGTGDYLTTPSSTDFDLPGDFVIETWVRLTAPPSAFVGAYGAAVVSRYQGSGAGASDANKGYQLRINGTASEYDTINFYTGVTDLNFSTAVALNTWHHLAVARSGSSLRVYLNGSQVGSTVTNSDSLTPSGSRSLSIGRLALEPDYLFDLPGQIDDLRITKGIARYTGETITVPTAAFPTS